MDPTEILHGTLELYRSHWRHLVMIAAAVYVPLGGLSALLAFGGVPGIVAANVLNLAAIFLVQGALVKAVEDLREGRSDRGVGVILRVAGGRLAALAVAGVAAAAGIIVGLGLLVIPGLVLLTWWLVLAPVIMLEGRGVTEGFARSRQLVRGSSWPVFGVAVLTLLVLLAFSLTLGMLLLPLDEPAARFLQTAVGNSVAAPFVAVAWTLTYFRLRELEDPGAQMRRRPAEEPPRGPAVPRPRPH
jgi:hypothetical protein